MNINHLAEKSRRFSPYAYAVNNPVYFIDPDGMMAENMEGSSSSKCFHKYLNMKKSIFLSIILLIVVACSTTRHINFVHSYQVDKIDSIKKFYIIYAHQSERKFKIISEKKNSTQYRKISIGKSYPFKLVSILNQPIKLGDKRIDSGSNLLVNCFMFEDDTEICRENDIPDMHYAENLIGLCFVK